MGNMNRVIKTNLDANRRRVVYHDTKFVQEAIKDSKETKKNRKEFSNGTDEKD